jgi:SAM-dependent methyltransferase
LVLCRKAPPSPPLVAPLGRACDRQAAGRQRRKHWTFVAGPAQYCSAIAVHDHEESLAIARRRLGPQAVKRGSCIDLPFPDGFADGVTAADVIEHIDNDRGALREMARLLKPGGVPVITALWSDWDVALHHIRLRRYRRPELIDSCGRPASSCCIATTRTLLLSRWYMCFASGAHASPPAALIPRARRIEFLLAG